MHISQAPRLVFFMVWCGLWAGCQKVDRTDETPSDMGNTRPDAFIDLTFDLPEAGQDVLSDWELDHPAPPEDGSTVNCHQPWFRVRTEGGLTQYGAGWREYLFFTDGYLHIDDQTPETPVDGLIPVDRLRTLELLSIDPDALEDGYGDCCNSWVDGSDLYVSFARSSQPDREVRISSWQEAPQALVQFLDTAFDVAWDLQESGPHASLPALFDLPEGIEGGCDQHIDHGTVRFTLAGSDGTWIDESTIPAYVEVISDFQMTVDGTVTEELVDRELRLVDYDGVAWVLTFLDYPSVLPRLGLMPGHEVRLRIRMALAFAAYTQSLAISDQRGVLFVADSGLSGIAELLQGYQVEVVDGGCPQIDDDGLCSPAQEQALLVTVSDPEANPWIGGEISVTDQIVYPGEWAHVPIRGQYDLAFINLRSFRSGLCDDYGNHAYAAMALTGSSYCGLGCRRDADCPAEWYCDSCAYSSCPTCTDCLSACSPHHCQTEPEATCNTPRPDCEESQVAVVQGGCWVCIDRDQCGR